MPFPFWIVDAFVSDETTPAHGNPAAVVRLEKWPRDEQLQQIAAEFGLSETAFVARENESWRLRWFTPQVEVDLCGHATLTAAHVLNQEEISFQTRSGVLRVVKGENALWWMEFPAQEVEPCALPDELANSLGVANLPTFRASDDWLIELESETNLRDLAPDLARLATVSRALDLRGVIVTARCEDANFDFVSRFFAPAIGIDEDPVTGSAHTKLAPFWGRKLGKTELRGRQISERGGVVEMKWHGERVFLGGRAQVRDQGNLLK